MSEKTFSLGTRQQINFTLTPEDFGKTDAEKESCLEGLKSLDISIGQVDHMEYTLSAKSRPGFATAIETLVHRILARARVVGDHVLEESRQAEAEAERAKRIAEMAEAEGVDADNLERALAFLKAAPGEKMDAAFVDLDKALDEAEAMAEDDLAAAAASGSAPD